MLFFPYGIMFCLLSYENFEIQTKSLAMATQNKTNVNMAAHKLWLIHCEPIYWPFSSLTALRLSNFFKNQITNFKHI